jgi:hypothetical protein
MNRLNRIANVATDTGEALIVKGGSFAISGLTFVADVAEGGCHWSGGFKEKQKLKASAGLAIAADEIDLDMRKRRRAHELDLVAFEASITS